MIYEEVLNNECLIWGFTFMTFGTRHTKATLMFTPLLTSTYEL